eukprot:6205387-Pleurochrysis_carterae.AAC.2
MPAQERSVSSQLALRVLCDTVYMGTQYVLIEVLDGVPGAEHVANAEKLCVEMLGDAVVRAPLRRAQPRGSAWGGRGRGRVCIAPSILAVEDGRAVIAKSTRSCAHCAVSGV